VESKKEGVSDNDTPSFMFSLKSKDEMVYGGYFEKKGAWMHDGFA
jgi:hypothetical protein